MKAFALARIVTFRTVLVLWAFAAVVGANVLAGAMPASACEHTSPASTATSEQGYAVTDDNATALELGIEYRDNLDYEIDATEVLNPAGTDTVCEHLSRWTEDGYLLSWYECEGELPAA